ncbi:6754_t:CDS:2 [Entrophospora sp. SA101]|nr:6754_t:CDS:2 [Entrophospora sp. SA101]
MKFSASKVFLVTLLVFTTFLLFADAESVQHKNGVDAEALFEKFKTFTTDTPCEPDNVACIDGNFAKCHETLDNDGNVVNTWAISQCAEGTNCYPLPLVFSRGVSLVCDFDRRIKEALAS